MRRPPPISHAALYPATAGTLALALIATFAWWARVDCSMLLADAHVAHGHLHRLLTASLLHRDPIHLCFNFFWIWTLGTLIERHLGPMKTFALYGLLAVVSGAAEFALLDGAVGLSGVGFGLFGLTWVLWARDERFVEADVDHKTVTAFFAWFLLGAITTATGIFAVANLAHAVGGLFGAALAWAFSRPTPLKSRAMGVPAFALVALLIAATFARPILNLSPRRGQQEAWLGYRALLEGRDADAVHWYRDATAMRGDAVAADWFNLAIAYARCQDHQRAMQAYNEAARLDPRNRAYRDARDQLQDYLALLE